MRQSPALGLAHEVIHGVRHDKGIFIPMGTPFPWKRILLEPYFHELEEIPTIGLESRVANDLG